MYVGDITISGVTLTVDSDLNGASPQFTLTCISTGGPATTVTWTRDSGEVMGEESTVLDDAENADYNHTLTVTDRLGGLYTCTVENAKPSTDSQSFTVEGEMFTDYQINTCTSCFLPSPAVALPPPSGVTAIQTGPTSITVTWTPPTPLDGITGYIIYYTSGSDSGSVDVSGGSTDMKTLTGLQNGDTYNISILATSEHFNSDAVEVSGILLPTGTPCRLQCLSVFNMLYICSSRPTSYQCGSTNNSHLHLPLLDSFQ